MATATVTETGTAQRAKVFHPHPAQMAVLQSEARFTAACAGTGGGKTAIGPLWLMPRIQAKPGGMWLVVAPTYPILSRATVPTLIETFKETGFQGVYKEQKRQYELPCGGIIYCLSADNPKGLEGGQYDAAWVDEGGQLKYSAWVAIQGRVGQKRAPVLITTTPYGRNWLYHEFYKRWMAGDPDYFVKQWASDANPVYTTDEVKRARQTLRPERFAMRYEGRFMKMAGLVYPDLEGCIVVDEPVPEGRKVGGIDFGWNNPFAALGAVLDRDDVLHVYFERYLDRTPISEHADALLPLGVDLWHADPAGADQRAELRKAGLRVRPAKNDIMAGIDLVNARINTGRLRIHSCCEHLIEEAESYHYPEKEDAEGGEKPIDEYNHALDALRYLVAGVDKRKRSRLEEEPEAETVLQGLREDARERYNREEKPWLDIDNEAIWE